MAGRPLYIAEAYFAHQGEGPHLGRPSIFLRTQLCSVACRWCDSKFSWRAGTPDQAISDLDLLAKLKTFAPVKQVVFTGGEPFQQGEAVARVTRHLLLDGFAVDFETSGTMVPHRDHPLGVPSLHGWWAQPFYVVSPKLPSAQTKIPTNPKAIEWFKGQDSCFKFVINDEADLRAAEAFIANYRLSMDRVFFMPCATDQATLAAKQKWLMEAAPHAQVTTRMHVLAYGSERGH